MSARSYEYPLTLTVQKSGGVVAARPGLLAGTMTLALSLRPKIVIVIGPKHCVRLR